MALSYLWGLCTQSGSDNLMAVSGQLLKESIQHTMVLRRQATFRFKHKRMVTLSNGTCDVLRSNHSQDQDEEHEGRHREWMTAGLV